MSELRNALRDRIQSVVSDVACELGCNDFEAVVKIKVEDGWTRADVISLGDD